MDRLATALDDRYRIIREIGSGGMATVYLAEDLRHGRQVALKVLRPELAATMGPDRFFREIQVAARLQHPHILPLHDSGEADGFLYFVMPYVTGESLRERIDRVGELPVADAVRIMGEVADALSHSHAQAVVHRDIKPDNIMLSGRHALVTDFGVAKAVSESASESRVTTAGVALGTPAYMAPEQAAADPQLDHRVDIYALGIVAYEMLSGRTPFTGLPPQQMLMAHVKDAPGPLRQHRDACPPELESIVMRCLAKRPADRWQSADEIVHALEPLAVSSGGITPTQTRPSRATLSAGLPSKVLVAVSIVSALALGTAGWFAWSRRGTATAPAAMERVQLTSTGRAIAPALSPDGSRLAFGERTCDSAGFCTVDVRVQDIAGAGGTTVLRGLLGLGALQWTPDGRWLVFTSSLADVDRWGAWAVPALGGEARYLGCCTVTTSHTDTVVVTGPLSPGDTGSVIRLVTVSDGIVRDSIAFPGTHERIGVSWMIPGTDRLLAVVDQSGRVIRRLIDRTGRLTDSLDVLAANPWVNALTLTEHGFVLPVLDRDRGLIDLHEYRIEGGQRFDRRARVIARGIQARAGLTMHANGQLVLADGHMEFSIWALERASIGAPFARRRLAQSTTYLMGSITDAGDRILLVRGRPNEPRVRDVLVMPFAGGAERSLASLQDLLDWDWHQDGRSVLVVQQPSVARYDVSELDASTGELRTHETLTGAREWFETVAGGGYVNIRGTRQVELHGLQVRSDTTWTWPATVSTIMNLEPSPDGAHVASMSWDVGDNWILIHRASLADGRVEQVARLGGEGGGAITWMADGSLLVPINESAWSDTWYRIPPRGGTPERLPMQLGQDASFRFTRNGLRGLAREALLRSDVFLLRPPSATMSR